jgi:frataxin
MIYGVAPRGPRRGATIPVETEDKDMAMDESAFTSLAAETLDRFAEAIDDALGDEIDVEMSGGILTLSLAAGGQYVLNAHAPNREIWLSSPTSGAWHFAPRDGGWVSVRDGKTDLVGLLTAELESRFGTAPGL